MVVERIVVLLRISEILASDLVLEPGYIPAVFLQSFQQMPGWHLESGSPLGEELLDHTPCNLQRGILWSDTPSIARTSYRLISNDTQSAQNVCISWVSGGDIFLTIIRLFFTILNAAC
jgi:hypothetical protein